MVDQIDLWSRAETGQSLIWLISHIARRGKNQFIVGLPQCNMKLFKVTHFREKLGFDGKKPK